MRRSCTRATFASAGAFAAIATISSPAKPAQFEFKCGTTLPLSQTASPRLVQMWADIERESGGRIHTQFFPGSILGGDDSMLNQVRLGVLQFQLMAAGTLSA